MSNREDKDKRRQERLAAEQAAQKQAAQRKRLGLVGGAVLVAAVVAIVLVFVVFKDDDGGDAGGPVAGKAPTQGTTNLAEAARAAGCTVSEQLPDEGNGHVTTSMAGKYKTNPPTSGDHDPTPAQDGIYTADNPPDLEQSVHALEHGRIEIQYKKGTDQATIDNLESVGSEKVKGDAGYHQLVFPNLTDMDAAVAAVAWRYEMTCPAVNDKIYDAIRAFRTAHIDKGPEFVP